MCCDETMEKGIGRVFVLPGGTGSLLLGASSVLIPKRYDYGATWSMYQQEEEDTVDVMFFGSSLAYCDVIPSVIYEESGVTSYVMAGPEQTMPVTYRYVSRPARPRARKWCSSRLRGCSIPSTTAPQRSTSPICPGVWTGWPSRFRWQNRKRGWGCCSLGILPQPLERDHFG